MSAEYRIIFAVSTELSEEEIEEIKLYLSDIDCIVGEFKRVS